MLRVLSIKPNNIDNFSSVYKSVKRNQSLTTRLNEKIKGTMVENWAKYWKHVYNDYREVAIDTGKDIKERPLKAAIYFTILGTLGICAKTNPEEATFRDSYINAANDLVQVDPSLQKPEAVQHVKYVEQCCNRELVRRLNLGIATIMWADVHSVACSTYESNCSYLQVPYLKFKDRILDIGCFNTWWILKDRMVDYDINY